MISRLASTVGLSAPRAVLVVSLGYAITGIAARATLGQARIAGVPWALVQSALMALAALVFVVSTVWFARRAGPRWRGPTVRAAVGAAVLGAALEALVFAVRVRGGAACNQCQPALHGAALMLAAGLIAAIGAPLVGAAAQRLGPEPHATATI